MIRYIIKSKFKSDNYNLFYSKEKAFTKGNNSRKTKYFRVISQKHITTYTTNNK